MSERLRRLGPAWPALLGLALLALAQTRFETQRITPLIGLAALLGLGAWAWSVRLSPPAADRLGALDDWERPVTNLQLGGLAATAGLALGGWFSIRGNAFNAPAVAGWLGAAGLWLAVWWPWGGHADAAPPEPAERRRRLLALALVLATTALGGWLRFHRLSLTPNEMTQDHGWKLLDIQTILDGGRPLFLVNNTGREPGQFYYTAALIRLFGLPRDFMALKIGNGIVGTLTIPAIYLFAREAGGRKTGVLAAALYAIGKWPLATTRMGLRYPYATLPAALIFWSLWRYARSGERRDALLVGLWLGLGLYGYIGIRVMPLAIAATMALLLLDPRRRSWRAAGRLAGHGLLIAGTAALLFLPLGRFMVEFPGDFWHRVSTRIGDRERSIEREVCGDAAAGSGWCGLGVFLENNARALGAFTWRGDRTEVNAVYLDPFLDWATGALLLAGLPLLAWRLARERSPRWLALTACVPITLLASTLSLAFPIENPSAARTGVAMPLIFALAAAPLAALIDWMLAPGPAPAPPRRWRIGAAALLTAALLAVCARENYLRYFRDFDRQYRAFIPNSGEVARASLAYAPRGIDPGRMFLLDWPHWQETRLVGIHLGDIRWADTHVIHAGEPLPARPGSPPGSQPLLFMLNNQDEARRQELRRAFPGGELARIDSEIPDKWFYLYYVPAGP